MPNTEFSCRPVSAGQTVIGGLHYHSTDCVQADNCNDLLGRHHEILLAGIDFTWRDLSHHFCKEAVVGDELHGSVLEVEQVRYVP
jgi:hypothetical protein